MNKRIMLSGKGGTGKDTVADYLVAMYGFKKISFAEPIYKIAKEYFGMEIKDRWLLQQIGNKLREIDDEVWVRYAFNEASKYEKVVFADTRFEIEYLKGIELGYIPIRLYSHLNVCVDRIVERDGVKPNMQVYSNHIETQIANFNWFAVTNNGTLQDLYKTIDTFVLSNLDDFMLAIKYGLQKR